MLNAKAPARMVRIIFISLLLGSKLESPGAERASNEIEPVRMQRSYVHSHFLSSKRH
jgi:hypothetical protein